MSTGTNKLELSMEDSLLILAQLFLKIIKVNLKTGEFYVVRSNVRDDDLLNVNNIAEWFQMTGEHLVYEKDRAKYLLFTDITNIMEHFFSTDDTMEIRYRRLDDNNVFRWVQMEFIKLDEFTLDEPIIMVYIWDIHENYSRELERHREMQYLSNFDSLTGLNNFYCYKIDSDDYDKNPRNFDIGIIFCDLNGLKLINDTQGHSEGNKQIKKLTDMMLANFSGHSMYRIAGDEFLVRMDNLSEAEFQQKAKDFYKLVYRDEIPVTALGWAYEEKAKSIYSLVDRAEKAMYKDKNAFYKLHPEYKRGKGIPIRNESVKLLKVMMDSYFGIILIDLEEDTYDMVKKYHIEGAEYTEAGVYSFQHRLYCDYIVDPEFRDLHMEVGSSEYLAKALAKEKNIICDYRHRDGTWLRDTYQVFEKENGRVKKVVLYTQDIDEQRVLRYYKTKEQA